MVASLRSLADKRHSARAATADKTFMGKETYAAVHWWTLVSIVNSFNNGKPAGLRADSPWWSYIVGGCSSRASAFVAGDAAQSENDSARLYRQNIVTAILLVSYRCC